ncbi:MAG: 4'-phosphopantetheinyl transferase superfamily protein [Prevotella sp.]|nr:4'-phosphopantetheinyl transferase superfamily protein [Prevotella sp.]MCM1075630.1 4'-phosphopantetheinyl transferase superfamily protein [Ruminococcus sp.]
MNSEFIYCRHRTPIGVKVEEVSGGEGRSAAVWRAMAAQIWKENGRTGYRNVAHLDNGAPLLWDEPARISITHTQGLYAVATLPPTPEANLESFSERTALGIDAERADRAQVFKVRERFLSEDELSMISAEDLAANITAWICKEALYKAALTPGLDWRKQILISKLPEANGPLGSGRVQINGTWLDFLLYSFRTGEDNEFIVTIAITAHTATYSKNKN